MHRQIFRDGPRALHHHEHAQVHTFVFMYIYICTHKYVYIRIPHERESAHACAFANACKRNKITYMMCDIVRHLQVAFRVIVPEGEEPTHLR